jgi:Na+/H+ antiporter NhaA
MDTTDRDHRLAAVDDWLYVVIVGALALYLIVGVIAWTWMLLTGVSAPGAFTTVLSTIAGGLIGILAPLGPRDRGRST